MEKWLPIFQIPRKGRTPPKTLRNIRNKERYHRRRAQNLQPTRLKLYEDLTEEERKRWKDAVTRSRMKRYHSSPSYKTKMNKLRTLASMRARQRADGRVKRCNVSGCNEVRPLIDFEKRNDSYNNKKYTSVRFECKKCRSKRNKEYYQNNKDKHKTDDGEWTVIQRRKDTYNDHTTR